MLLVSDPLNTILYQHKFTYNSIPELNYFVVFRVFSIALVFLNKYLLSDPSLKVSLIHEAFSNIM